MPRKAASSTIDERGATARPPAPRRAIAAEAESAAGQPADGTGAVLAHQGSVVVLLATIANQIGASGSLTYQKRHGLSSAEWRIFGAGRGSSACVRNGSPPSS